MSSEFWELKVQTISYLTRISHSFLAPDLGWAPGVSCADVTLLGIRHSTLRRCPYKARKLSNPVILLMKTSLFIQLNVIILRNQLGKISKAINYLQICLGSLFGKRFQSHLTIQVTCCPTSVLAFYTKTWACQIHSFLALLISKWPLSSSTKSFTFEDDIT